jgi:excisionase family DNA binding protein
MIKKKKDILLNTKEAAQYLGVTTGTLAVWRSEKRYNLVYIKVGRLVKYSKSSLDQWLTSRRMGGFNNVC